VAAGMTAIRSGKSIVTDTHMARAGIRQSDLNPLGATLKCYSKSRRNHTGARGSGCRHFRYGRRHLCDRQRPHRVAATDRTG
jgi:precorrin isomerase